MLEHLDVGLIVAFHDERFARFAPLRRVRGAAERLWHAIEANHLCNRLRWDAEAQARRRDSPAAAIARGKHSIDGYDERRQDAVETIDENLRAAFADLGPSRPDARLSGETPGRMIDRLSVLALELHHMSLQAARADASAAHRARCRTQAERLAAQRAVVAGGLAQLMREVAEGTARFQGQRPAGTYAARSPSRRLGRRGVRYAAEARDSSSRA